MRCIHSLVVTTALGLVCLHASAQKAQAHSLCAADEEPVFSCMLQGSSRKMTSLCASPVSTQGERRFRYLYGRPSKIELRYPASGNSQEGFTFTRISYIGDTFGYAYTFTNRGYKYILSAAWGLRYQNAGLRVQRVGEAHALRSAECKWSTLVKTYDDNIPAMTSGLKIDPDIAAHGVPSTR
ncbi:hypothetical protein [Variovorax paradoxus]|uniref:hypothetical protein n=1 Tax=Variovorax paradoxus TaxID=34073 RepID=UPI003D651E3B